MYLIDPVIGSHESPTIQRLYWHAVTKLSLILMVQANAHKTLAHSHHAQFRFKLTLEEADNASGQIKIEIVHSGHHAHTTRLHYQHQNKRIIFRDENNLPLPMHQILKRILNLAPPPLGKHRRVNHISVH